MRKLAVVAILPLIVAAAPVRVTGTMLVHESVSPNGSLVEVRTSRIPYIVGSSCYRWTIRFKASAGQRTFTEKFTLPGSATNWGGNEGKGNVQTKVSPDRAAARTPVFVNLADGMATNGWCVAEGDPAGRYKIEVYDAKRLLHRFDFDVVLPPESMG